MVHNLHGVWRVEISIPKEIYMAKDAHNKAAEHHENAAKAHRMAAEHHGKGDHEAGKKHSATALEHSGKAHEASKAAHEKSDRKSTRLNSSHLRIPYAVFCLKEIRPTGVAEAAAGARKPTAAERADTAVH